MAHRPERDGSLGVQLHTAHRGSGDPIVFLHGMGTSSSTWDAAMDTLSNRFTCVAIDLLGHGASPVPEDPEEYSRDATLESVYSTEGRRLAQWESPGFLV